MKFKLRRTRSFNNYDMPEISKKLAPINENLEINEPISLPDDFAPVINKESINNEQKEHVINKETISNELKEDIAKSINLFKVHKELKKEDKKKRIKKNNDKYQQEIKRALAFFRTFQKVAYLP
jgi:hypothetical protein